MSKVLKNKYEYKIKNKIISIPLFREEESTLADYIQIGYNSTTDQLYIYSFLRYFRRYVKYTHFPICFDFTNPRCAIRDKIRKVVEKDHFVSFTKIRKITKYSNHTVSKHYMILKREVFSDK